MSGHVPHSHTSTRQWQSFELRMRRRRVDLCLQRAQGAIAAGRMDAARFAVEEAQRLDPEHEAAAALAAHLPALLARANARRARSRRMTAAAALFMGLSVLGWWALRPAPGTTGATDATATVIPSVAPRPPAPLPSTGTDVGTSGSRQPRPRAAAAASEAGMATARTDPRTTGAVAEAARPSPTPPPARGEANRTASQSAAQSRGSQAPIASPVRPGAAGAARQPARPEPPVTDPSTPATGTGFARATSVADASLPATAPSAAPAALPEPGFDAGSAGVPAIDAPVSSERLVRTVLNRYQAAYNDLDAAAAGVIWPSVDIRALARAFDGLASQRVSFGHCDVDVTGTSATADCRGQARWRPKVGGGTQSADRRWQFELAQKGEEWFITRATVR
jgi:hypothetical protein